MLFESKNNGWLLYNSGSNSFVQMDDRAAEFVRQVAESPNGDFSSNFDMILKLRLGGFLVEDGKDDELFNIIKMKYLIAHFSNSHLKLTIALTRECNFGCHYCYQQDRIASCIDDDTEEKIVNFIKKHNLVNEISISWYGGEPLLEFGRIKSLTEKIEIIGKKYSASLTTNGYFLTSEVIAALDNLKIKDIQITIDGSKEKHDSRRHLIGGGATYDVIISNIDNLFQSGWEGELNCRVNIDSTNEEEFVKVYRFFEDRYPSKINKQIFISPGFVDDHRNPDGNSCYFDSRKKGEFLSKLASEFGINALPIFPRINIGGCGVNTKNAYLIGPEGELYKCWDDLGEKDEIVGYIDSFTNWNTSLIAQGIVEASYVENDKCKKCFCFPICNGGCPKYRILNKRDGGKRDYCSHFKSHAKELLEIHYEQTKKQRQQSTV